ncbi:MAG: SDR family oxidoreductase [Planctomycetes bacterium]|nr:SDR family oxidoreductase [Planctomycetota bacterium]MCH8251558.1 SDR family oxidoreductase [Planctomycetota bacterium]
MANILVTGGAGFIGSHLVTKFVELGHQVRVFDNLSSGSRANLEHVADRFEFIEGDLCHPEECLRACLGIEYVFHEAALASVPRSVDDPEPSHDTNINGTFNLLLSAVHHKVKRVIYAASSSAYGDSDKLPKTERMKATPLSPYAVQKLAGEAYCTAFYKCYGLETISLRYFNVFGARQDPASDYAAAIPAFVVSILRGVPPKVFGDGEQTRDFTHIDNVVHGNVLAMKVRKTRGEVINCACGGKISINRVIEAINKALGKNVRPEYLPPRTGDVMHSAADIALAKKLLGFEPIVSFEDGLGRAIEYYKSLA